MKLHRCAACCIRGREERIRGQAIGSCTSPFGICIRFVGRMFLPAAHSPWSTPSAPLPPLGYV